MTNEKLIAEVREIATNDQIGSVYARQRVLEMADVLSASQEAAQARIAELEAVVTDLSVCACGCPISEHESYGEDGESCENETHICNRVFPAVAATLRELEAQAAVLAQAVKDSYVQAFEGENDVYCAHCTAHWPDGAPSLETHMPDCLVVNLPAVVQQHLERDRAAKRVVDIAEHVCADADFLHLGKGLLFRLEASIAACRAAGGEGG